MKEAGRRKDLFWMLHTGGWLICGVVLFASGVSHAPVANALLRNALFTVLGAVASLGLRRVYLRLGRRPQAPLVQWLAVPVLSYAAALVCGGVVNVVTFWHQGVPPRALPWERLFAGDLNFAFVFAIWSTLYLGIRQYQHGASSPDGTDEAAPARESYRDRLAVEGGQTVRLVRVEDVAYLEAAGDYVEVHADGSTSLLRSTMHSLEQQLDPRLFLRIHRSTIVNLDHIAALRPHRNGEYFVVLNDGTELKLSRSFRAAFRDRLGEHL